MYECQISNATKCHKHYTGGVMEIVAYIVVMPLVDKVGRKIMLVIMMATAGLTLVGSTVAKEYSNSNKGGFYQN